MVARTPIRPADALVEVAPGVSLATWTTRREPGIGLPVVLVHGGPGLWASFDDLIEVVADLAVVHTYDQ